MIFTKWGSNSSYASTGNCVRGPETGFGEINRNFREEDFWPGTTSGLPVIRPERFHGWNRLLTPIAR
jgi:hypothetical protein